MDRKHARRVGERTLEEVMDAEDLRSVIAAALAARPVDEQSLRRGVWTYVSSELRIGTSPGDVIARLTTIVDASSAQRPAREAVRRRVMRWCVEACFGHLGGEPSTAGAV